MSAQVGDETTAVGQNENWRRPGAPRRTKKLSSGSDRRAAPLSLRTRQEKESEARNASRSVHTVCLRERSEEIILFSLRGSQQKSVDDVDAPMDSKERSMRRPWSPFQREASGEKSTHAGSVSVRKETTTLVPRHCCASLLPPLRPSPVLCRAPGPSVRPPAYASTLFCESVVLSQQVSLLISVSLRALPPTLAPSLAPCRPARFAHLPPHELVSRKKTFRRNKGSHRSAGKKHNEATRRISQV
ncbi:hypothetical protein TGFOU_404190 [Toxoplasma gondii FOU]|uniref:Uncharacterized protein n=1 Tax=Toxoplasma gondii FOU TaxID=943167 RepID=A0A086L7R9_TOXGO|nr:hypothetical protein TGFOU_404190 [Toxoplasma gondii FOU]